MQGRQLRSAPLLAGMRGPAADKSRRAESGLSQRKAAEVLGVDQATVSRDLMQDTSKDASTAAHDRRDNVGRKEGVRLRWPVSP